MDRRQQRPPPPPYEVDESVRRRCNECHWIAYGGVSDQLPRCDHPDNLSAPSLVDGTVMRIHDPGALRSQAGLCGLKGNWWEPQSRWRRFWRKLGCV